MGIVAIIQNLCKENGITINQLEKNAVIGRGTIARWDDHLPSIDKVGKVADYFGVSVDYLLGKTEKPTQTGELNDGLQDIYYSLAQEMQNGQIDPEDIRQFMAIIKKNTEKNT